MKVKIPLTKNKLSESIWRKWMGNIPFPTKPIELLSISKPEEIEANYYKAEEEKKKRTRAIDAAQRLLRDGSAAQKKRLCAALRSGDTLRTSNAVVVGPFFEVPYEVDKDGNLYCNVVARVPLSQQTQEAINKNKLNKIERERDIDEFMFRFVVDVYKKNGFGVTPEDLGKTLPVPTNPVDAKNGVLAMLKHKDRLKDTYKKDHWRVGFTGPNDKTLSRLFDDLFRNGHGIGSVCLRMLCGIERRNKSD